MAVVLDTSFLVDLSRRRPDAVAHLERLAAQHETLLVPTVVAAEYLAGSRDPASDLEALRSAAHVLDFTLEDARAAAALAREALERGSFPGWIDALIAGFAASRGGLPLVTADTRHFPGTQVQPYREPT